MRYLIFGTGGVGGYFGARLSVAGVDVHFIARGKHLDAMKKNGLTVRSAKEQYHVPAEKMHGDVAEAGTADVVLFCVKAYDTESATQQLLPALRKDSVIISLQNGIDNEEKIQQLAPAATVYGGVAYIYSTITAPGVVTRNEGPAKIVFGPLDNRIDEKAKTILSTFQSAGVNADLSGITALTRLTLGEILANTETCDLVRDAMRETEAVARANLITLEPNLVDSFFETMSRFTNDTRSSLYYDLVNGKPMEVEALAGTVVRLGRHMGVPTPIQAAIYASLLPYHRKHLHALTGGQV
jgi:2-dehydropantoate 2-reductase